MATFTLKAIYDYNICTYYILPLIKLNKNRFGPKNFRQCYIDREGSAIYVEVNYMPQGIEFDMHYLSSRCENGLLYLAFELPDIWSADMSAFKKGEFLKMSDAAKEMIRTYGGMHYKTEGDSGKPFTDARLMAIDSDLSMRESLRKALERELSVQIPSGQELISQPSESNYIDTAIQETKADGLLLD